MNTISHLTFLQLPQILLQQTGTSFQMNLVLYLAVVVILLAVIVLVVVYQALQVILQTSGFKTAAEEVLTTDWVSYLYVFTIGMVLISLYIYYQFI